MAAEATRPPVTAAESQAILQRSIDRYRLACHQRVAPFVDRHFSLRGTLRLHRHAIGLDLLRAPANAVLVAVGLLVRLLALGCRGVGRTTWASWLEARPIFFATAVSRALVQLMVRELLHLPGGAAALGAEPGDGAGTEPDGLTLAILADPALHDERADRLGPAPHQQHLHVLINDYTSARAAASDLVTNALLAGAGAAVFKQLTPGALSLAPLIAATVAQQTAIAAFPLGASLGAAWYAAFPPDPSPLLLAATIAALLLLGSITAAFAGVVADPLLRLTGVHRRRLHRLIDALAARLNGRDATLNVPDPYLARVFDLVDILRAVRRSTG